MQNIRSSIEWRELVSRIIKSEMTKRKLKYSDLSDLLKTHGTIQTSANLRNKINRGILGADLFLQLLLVMQVKQLDRKNILDILDSLT
jgi:hypothetical protein